MPVAGHGSLEHCACIAISFELLNLGYFLLPQMDEAALFHQQRLAAEAGRPKVERNNFKCPKCHRVNTVLLHLMCRSCFVCQGLIA